MKTAAPLAIALLLSAAMVHSEEPSKDAKELIGVWKCVSAMRDGNPLPEAIVQELRLTLTDDRYKTERGQQVLFDSTYRIDAAKKPKQIDMIGTEGANAGKAAQGIYLLEGDKLTLCYTMPGQDRPADFTSKAGSGATLAVWQRMPK
jgi:uncharacterized protein (TIGR03067 family)